MARKLLFAIVVVANAALVLLAMTPGIITFAEIPPKEVVCDVCSTVEAQRALVRAMSMGRAEIQSLVRSNIWPLAMVAALSVAAAAGLLWAPGRGIRGEKKAGA
jgi:hypothetical protein